jgi:protein involved in polysaccharide export with SLBB domain
MLMLVLTGVVPLAARAAQQDALPPGIPPRQIELWKQMLQAGKELPQEAKDLLEARPDLKDRLPEDLRQKLEEKKPEVEAGKKPAPPATQEMPGFLPAYDWKTSVYVGGLFLNRLQDNESKTLIHFGHEVFAPRPGGAVFLENLPVTPDYVVGPGDEVIVRLWGRMEGTYRLTVDRDGKIFFPKLGSFPVAGKTFGELRSFLQAKISSIAEVSSDVSLGQTKGIRVSVVGEVQAPGWYSVSSVQTALQALSLAGGVKDIGSLRRVKIKRGGKEIGEIDLYEILLRGDTRSDIPLRQGDAVFVPVVGKLAAITGEVRRPAIYELKREKTLLDLVDMGGGFSPSAYKRRITVERLEGHTTKVVLDEDAERLEREKRDIEIADGDIVRVLAIAGPEQNAIVLEGNVLHPGKYELKPGMTVGSLFKDETDFLPDTFFDYALLTRQVPPDMHKVTLSVNLKDIVLEKKEGADIALQPRDRLKVFPRRVFRDTPKATISGEVRMIRSVLEERGRVEREFAPDNTILDNVVVGPRNDNNAAARFETKTQGAGRIFPMLETAGVDGRFLVSGQGDNTSLTYEVFPGATVADLVKMAGGLTHLASLERAEVVRVDGDRRYRTIYFHLGQALEGNPQENIPLENEDHVRIHSLLESRYRKTVTAGGEVNHPGDYVYTEGMKLSDLLFKAGGFKEGAYAREAEITRREVAPGGELVRTRTMTVSPERALYGEPENDIPLQEYDILVVRQIPDWTVKIQVTLAGEVRFPGAYSLRKGERLSSLIKRAGGFTPDAYIKAAQFTRVSTQKAQQEAIDKLISDLELEVAQKAQAAGGALDREDIEANRDLMNARRAVIEQLKRAKAKGRVVIRLADADKLRGTSADILLEDGDRLEVPKKSNVVNVVGRVYNPTGVVYDPANDRLGYYLKMVGGPTESADPYHIFMIRADGSVVTRDNVGGGFSVFSGGLMSARVEPGDSIVVPEKLIQIRAMKDFKDLTQILFQIAVTTGVLIALF